MSFQTRVWEDLRIPRQEKNKKYIREDFYIDMAIMRDFGWSYDIYGSQPRVIIAKIHALIVAERLDVLEAQEKANKRAKTQGRYSNVEVRHNPQRE